MKMPAYQAVAITLFLLLPLAQEVSADSTSIEELLLFYEQEDLLVVTATRYTQKKKESPSAITVITKEDIRKHSWRNLIEALETVVGFDVTYNRRLRRPEIGARGMLGGSVGKRVLVMVDGRPVNRVADGSSDLGFETPMNNIERVEIIRGPGSALYGPNAFSGVINIITLSPTDDFTTDLYVTSGTAGARGYDLNTSNTIGAVGLSLSASSIHFDDEGIWKRNEDLGRDSFWGKLTYRDLILSAGYNTNDKGLPVRGRYDNGDFRSENRLWFIDGKYAFQATPSLNVNLHAYLNNEDRRLIYADNIVGTHPLAQNHIKEEIRTGGGITLDYLVSENFRLVSGTELRHEEFRFNLDLGSNQRETTNTGIFFQGEGRFFDDLLITAGGRYDHHSIYDGVISPRLSASYNFLDRGRLRLAYGESFRAPSFVELYLYVGATKVGNTALGPEEIKSFEAGISYTFSRYLDGEATFFYNKMEDGIIFDTNAFTFINKDGNAQSKGLEVELKSRPFNNLSIFSSYTYQDTEDEGGAEIANSPKHKINLGFTWERGPSTLTLSTHYKGNRRDLNGNYLGGYTTFNGKYQYKIMDNMHLSVAARNIFNNKYTIEKHDPQFTTGYEANDFFYEDTSIWVGLNLAY